MEKKKPETERLLNNEKKTESITLKYRVNYGCVVFLDVRITDYLVLVQ